MLTSRCDHAMHSEYCHRHIRGWQWWLNGTLTQAL